MLKLKLHLIILTVLFSFFLILAFPFKPAQAQFCTGTWSCLWGESGDGDPDPECYRPVGYANCEAQCHVSYNAESICANLTDPSASIDVQRRQCQDHMIQPCVPDSPTQSLNFGDLLRITLPSLGSSPTTGEIINRLLFYLFPIAGFLLLLYLVYGGYQILMSQGDPKSVAAGREKIQSAIIGFIIIFVAYWVVQIVGKILGIETIADIFS